MVLQYRELKRQYPGTLLFFRLGDFYELFFEDAVTGARELEITLTARHKERGQPIPMCGVPHMALAGHISKLVRKGYRVAICEQMEDARATKKLVRREVVRIITPGTAIDPQLLDMRQSIYLSAICGSGAGMAAAFLDLSTGEFRVTEATGADALEQIAADIEAYAPRELLFPVSLSSLFEINETAPSSDDPTISNAPPKFYNEVTALTPLDDWLWQQDACESLLKEHFGVRTLAAFGLDGKPEAIRAAGATLRYARETQRAAAAHITSLEFFAPRDHLVLDAVTIRNLDLVETSSQTTTARARTLLSVLDRTTTGMGARTLRAWLLRPLVKRGEIEARLAAVADLVSAPIERDELRVSFKEIGDLERLTARLNMGTATPRDLIAIRRSLEAIPPTTQALSDAQKFESSLLQILREAADPLTDVSTLIAYTINDEPAASFADGDVIRDGYNRELDELRHVSRNAKQLIAALESRERARSGIAALRVRYNGVFGYFIEVSKGSAARVPADYERKQTLTGAERFTTPELKKLEAEVLGAEDRTRELETSLFQEVRAGVAAETKRLLATARAIAALDALCSLAETAVRHNYTRPTIHDDDELTIMGGRHPIIEALEETPFIPNDVRLNNSTARLLIITGPNMGGKSTILRQTALICVLAQMGSFVPAAAARVPVLDRIWTRVGASDDIARGRSTFMVEMIETAAILHGATPRSLVLLDEIGRGTATFDGLSIAWAVAEHLHDSPQHAAKTLFATHYHELTELAARLPGAENHHITVAERDNSLIFLYRLEPGAASKSYGIAVARLAGLPQTALERAADVLSRLERYELDVFADERAAENEKGNAAIHTSDNGVQDNADDALARAVAKRARGARAAQATLFDLINRDLLDELKAVDINSISEREAKIVLQQLQQKIV